MSIEKEGYYYVLRRRARERVASSIDQKIEQGANGDRWKAVQLASITNEAVTYAQLEWRKFYSPETHEGFAHSWERLWYRFKNCPSHFDIAIWQVVNGQRQLQALALGKPNRSKSHLSLNWIERSFAPTYLPGSLVPVIACAEEYAKLLGCREVRVKDAVDPEKYTRYGYNPVNVPQSKSSWLRKEVQNG
jgi:hypothetical protein